MARLVREPMTHSRDRPSAWRVISVREVDFDLLPRKKKECS